MTTGKRPTMVPVNERGDRIGEYHQRATISDAEVDAIRDLREEHPRPTYKEIVTIMGKRGVKVSKTAVAQIIRFERRAQYAARWKRVDLDK